MKNAWKAINTAAITVTLALVTAQAYAAEKIMLVTHGLANDPYWNSVKKGADDAGKQLGVTVQYTSPDTYDMVRMASLITSAVNQHPAGIVITIPDASALGTPIKFAVASGVPVISVDAGSDVAEKMGMLLHIGQQNYAAGKAVGERLKQAGAKKGLCVNHDVGNVALDDRCRGLKDGFGGNVTVLPTTESFQEVKSKVAASLARDPEIDAVVAMSAAQGGEPTAAAAQESKRADLKVACFDLSPGILKDIVDGKVLFAVDQQPYLYGYLGVMFLTNYIRYGLLPTNKLIETGPRFVTKADAARVISLSAQSFR